MFQAQLVTNKAICNKIIYTKLLMSSLYKEIHETLGKMG